MGCPFNQDYEAYALNCSLNVPTVDFLKRALAWLISLVAAIVLIKMGLCFTMHTVLLHGIQLTFVQWFQQLLFLIDYCVKKVRTLNAVRCSGAPHMYCILYDNTIFAVEPQ
jgi:hypothetical protein